MQGYLVSPPFQLLASLLKQSQALSTGHRGQVCLLILEGAQRSLGRGQQMQGMLGVPTMGPSGAVEYVSS